jgi:hypothetical protein
MVRSMLLGAEIRGLTTNESNEEIMRSAGRIAKNKGQKRSYGVVRWHGSDMISSLVSYVFFVAGGSPALEEFW